MVIFDCGTERVLQYFREDVFYVDWDVSTPPPKQEDWQRGGFERVTLT